MDTTASQTEIILHPGDFYFGNNNARIKTLLGSCVSITMWHPKLLIGGMCHYILPSRSDKQEGRLDGRYAEEAMLMFLKETHRYNVNLKEFIIQAFGAGHMTTDTSEIHGCTRYSLNSNPQPCNHIACKNAASIFSLAHICGLSIETQNMGGTATDRLFLKSGAERSGCATPSSLNPGTNSAQWPN